MPTSVTTTHTSTVSLFAPGVDQMISSIEKAMTKLDGDVSIHFKPTPLATTTAPDGAAATVWNVRAHEYASINGHTTSIIEDQKFLESHNYFAAQDQSGADLECHFDHINGPATCVNKQPKHHRTFTSTFTRARPFATGYHRHVAVKVSNTTSSSSSSNRASSSQLLPTTSAAATAAVADSTPAAAAAPVAAQSGDGTTTESSAASNARMNSTSAATKAKSLPVLLVAASVLFAAVLTFQP